MKRRLLWIIPLTAAGAVQAAKPPEPDWLAALRASVAQAQDSAAAGSLPVSRTLCQQVVADVAARPWGNGAHLAQADELRETALLIQLDLAVAANDAAAIPPAIPPLIATLESLYPEKRLR